MIASILQSPESAIGLRTFTTTLSGLALETLPFLLIGTFLSSAIHVFVPDRILRRLFPKNRFLSILMALGIGAVLPICECATVPLARRLREKGLPASTSVAFLLAAPIINPMTIASTTVAFTGGRYPMLALRLAAGLTSALIIALVVELASRHSKNPEAIVTLPRFSAHRSPTSTQSALRPPVHRKKAKNPAYLILELAHHTTDEFLDTSRFLIAGISVAAFVRSIVPAGALNDSLSTPLAAIGAGSVSAYLFSLCSSADAFVARSLFAAHSYPACLAFLVLGPMIDIKNTFLLSRFLAPRQLVSLIALIFLVTGGICLAISGILAVNP